MTEQEPLLRRSARAFYRANFTPAFIYPLKGIWYFATHRYLHPLARARLLPLTLLSTCILVLLFVTAYLPSTREARLQPTPSTNRSAKLKAHEHATERYFTHLPKPAEHQHKHVKKVTQG